MAGRANLGHRYTLRLSRELSRESVVMPLEDTCDSESMREHREDRETRWDMPASVTSPHPEISKRDSEGASARFNRPWSVM